jgi:hypothetical protein
MLGLESLVNLLYALQAALVMLLPVEPRLGLLCSR